MTKFLIPTVVILTTMLKLTTSLVSSAEPTLDILAENDDADIASIPVVEDVEGEYAEPSSRAERSMPYGGQGYYKGNVGYSQCSAPEGLPGTCKPLTTCAQYYGTVAHYKYDRSDYAKSCVYGYGYQGVCCPNIYYTSRRPAVLTYDPHRYGYDPHYAPIPKEGIVKAIKYAYDYTSKHFNGDKALGRGEDDFSYWGNGIAKETYQPELASIAETGYFLSKVTEYLTYEYGYKPESYWDGGLKMVQYAQYLPKKYAEVCTSYYQQCTPSKYRSIDGSCNNMKNSQYGQARTSLGRIVIPRYSNKVHGWRLSVDGYPLPQARALRYQSLPDKNIDEKTVNMMYANFGQFITHDMVYTPFYQSVDGEFIDCCHGYKGGETQVSPKCYAMPVDHDPEYSHHTEDKDHHKVICLNFARGILAPNYDCAAGYGNPINIQTHHLDLSLNYGRSLNISHQMRAHKNGLVKMSKVGNQFYLPVDTNAECFNSSQGFCFGSGDTRTTIHPGMTLMQTLFHRHHNYIAKKLNKLNPHWDDEECYQEARRINIGCFQHIVYTEYLPLLLGWKFMYEHGILPTSQGYSYDYDEYANPWVYAEFSGAAFRLHTSIYGKIVLANDNYAPETELPLENYYNSAILYRNPYNLEKIVRGYIAVSKRKHDEYYDPAVTQKLLKDERHFGLDLAGFNIQRGRDYGIGTYNDYRELCGLPRAKQWSDFHDWIDPKVVDKFSKMYRHPDDVDLYSGGVAENHFPDALLGPTWWCIVGYQFQRTKLADRHFYDLGGMPHSYAENQLDEIRKMSFAAILCLTTDVKSVPAFAFRTISAGNPLVSCSDVERIPRMEYGAWKSSPRHPRSEL